MAERMTEYFENGAYTEKQNIIDVSDKVKFFEAGCVMGKAIDKLARVEDILEKYGVDIYNLDYILDDYSKNKGRDFAICEEMDNLKKDRDTWKRACELACETLKQVMGKPLWIGGNIPAPEVKDTEYFYQQAKKEGNDE